MAGVMHYSNFFRYFEACEEEFYRSLGTKLSRLKEKYGIMLPRVEAHCEYKVACKFDDLIEVVLRVREGARKTIIYDFELYRKDEKQLAAQGYLKCIAVDLNWKAVQLPPKVANIPRENMP